MWPFAFSHLSAPQRQLTVLAENCPEIRPLFAVADTLPLSFGWKPKRRQVAFCLCRWVPRRQWFCFIEWVDKRMCLVAEHSITDGPCLGLLPIEPFSLQCDKDWLWVGRSSSTVIVLQWPNIGRSSEAPHCGIGQFPLKIHYHLPCGDPTLTISNCFYILSRYQYSPLYACQLLSPKCR